MRYKEITQAERRLAQLMTRQQIGTEQSRLMNVAAECREEPILLGLINLKLAKIEIVNNALDKASQLISEAEILFRAQVKDNDYLASTYLKLGLKYKEQKKLTEAAGCYSKASQFYSTRPDQAHCYFTLGLIYEECKKWADSIENLTKAESLIEQNKDKARCNRKIAHGYMQLGNFAEAKRYLLTALPFLTDEPSKESCRFDLGLCTAKQEEWNTAIGYFKNLLDDVPEDRYFSKCHYWLGFCFQKMGNIAGAIEQYNLCLANLASDEKQLFVKCHFQLAEAHFQNKEWIKARISYREVIAHKNDEPRYLIEALVKTANCYQRLTLWDIAIDSYKILLRHNPNPKVVSDCHFNIGNCYLANEEWDNAIDSFRTCLACPATTGRKIFDANFMLAKSYQGLGVYLMDRENGKGNREKTNEGKPYLEFALQFYEKAKTLLESLNVDEREEQQLSCNANIAKCYGKLTTRTENLLDRSDSPENIRPQGKHAQPKRVSWAGLRHLVDMELIEPVGQIVKRVRDIRPPLAEASAAAAQPREVEDRWQRQVGGSAGKRKPETDFVSHHEAIEHHVPRFIKRNRKISEASRDAQAGSKYQIQGPAIAR